MAQKKLLRLPAIAIALTEKDGKAVVPDEIQVIRVGAFHDDRYGVVKITPDTLRKFKENFDLKVRKIDLALDFFHRSEDPAAGWIKSTELRNGDTELWAKVEWTSVGAQALADKQVRYVSADFDFDYQDNETKKKYGPTLFGAGLTNRPVIKGMAPVVELSEITEGENMDLEQLSAQVKELSEKVVALTEENKALSTKLTKTQKKLSAACAKMDDAAMDEADGDGDGDSEDSGSDDQEAQQSDSDVDKDDNDEDDDSGSDDDGGEDELDEGDVDAMDPDQAKAAAKKLLAKNKALKAGKKMSDRETRFTEMLRTGKVVEAQREAWMKRDMVKFAEKAQPVNLKRSGSGKSPETKTSAQEEVIALAEKYVKDGKADNLPEAQTLVLHEKPALRARYEKEIAF